MMGCSDDSEINRSDSLNGRKLRPLMPRPTTSIPTNNTYSAVANPSYCSLLHNPNLSTMNEHLVAREEQSKPDANTAPSVTSRWSPTPQQLHALEEMYRSGTRTPTTDQIQQIAGKLRRFGRIEGKNVFYWFQNHKARERQKRSRLPNSYSEEQLCAIESLERKESGFSRTGFEAAQAKKRATSSNCSTLSEESESIRRAVVSESSTEAWIQFEERELQRRRRSTQTKKATRQLMKPSSSTPPIYFTNTMTSTTFSPEALGTMDLKFSSTHNYEEESCRETQMLQLFPLWSDDRSVHNVKNKDTEVPMEAIDTSFTPNQFFEFLPLKN